MINSASAAFVVHDPRLRAATRKLNIVAWIAVALALVLIQLGYGWLDMNASQYMLGEFLQVLLWDSPDHFLFGLIVITALAPILAGWRRGAAVGLGDDRVRRRRRALALVGLGGAALMVALTQFDMALLRRAIDLGVEREGWDFGCIWPSGNYQAAFVGFGRLAVVLRIEAAVVDTLARDARSQGWYRQLLRVGLACALAACAAAPFAWLGIEDYVAAQHPRRWELPGLAHVVAFAVFELCARFGLFSPRRRRRSTSAAPSAPPLASPQRRRPSKQRMTPDPAALALGHRALASARRWFLVGTIAGSLALVLLVYVGGLELIDAFGYRADIPVAPALLLACMFPLLFVISQPALEGEAPASPRPSLSSPGLERVVELLGHALALLERGDDQQFDERYFEFMAHFEALEADELESLEARGVGLERVRCLPGIWVGEPGFFDAQLRRGIHRELMQIQATIIGRPSADPYRADLGACGLLDSIGLGWLRSGKARDPELARTHRTRNVAVLAVLFVWLVASISLGVLGGPVRLAFCIPGVNSCDFAIEALDLELAALVLMVLAPLVVWVVGAAHRRVAARCFELALPSDTHMVQTLSHTSAAFQAMHARVVEGRVRRLRSSLVVLVLLLFTVLIVSVSASFGRNDWLEDAIDAPGVYVMLGVLASFAMICLGPLRDGHRRLCGRVWLGWLEWRSDGEVSTSALLGGLVRHRIDLVTSSPPSCESIEALLTCVAAAPLSGVDREATLECLESALERAPSLSQDELLGLEQQLWVCELLIAEAQGG